MAASKRRRSDRALRSPMVHPVVPVGAPGASAEVLGRSCSRAVERGVGGGSRRVSRCWGALVSPMWWHALSVFVLCRGATYRSSSEKRLRFFKPRVVAYVRSPGSCAAHRRRSRENCGGTQQREVETSSIEPRPPNGMPIGGRSVRKLPNSLRTATEAVCAGSPRRPDRGSRRGGRAGPKCTLGRASPWSPTRPAVGGLVES